MVSGTVLIAGSLTLGLLLEWCILKFVTAQRLLAEVNARSSHETPTPTVGGIVIWVLVTAYLVHLSPTMPRLALGFAGACGLVALAGLWDDLRPLSTRLRFSIQLMAAAGLVVVVWPEPDVLFAVVLVIAVVWFTNLFNFMDGIDGIAAAQCLVFCLATLLLTGGAPGWSGEVLWVVVGATLAFLIFNWPPAKIFMGDVGSGFLGMLIAGLILHLWVTDTLPLTTSLILLAGFWFDATYTLCVRIATRQSFTQAHRSHFYQRLADRKGHTWTTTAFIAFALIWTVPLAWLSMRYPSWQLEILGLTLVPYLMLCRTFKAGELVED